MQKSLVLICAFAVVTASAQQSYRPLFFEDGAQRIERLKNTASFVNRMYKEHAEKNKLPGLAYAVVADGQLLYTGSLGYTDAGKKIPVTSASVFRIASMTKSITALAIMRLRDEGMLRLDDPAAMYIPGMKKLNYLSSDAPVITIRHLLTHTAGFPEDNAWGDRQLAEADKALLQLAREASFSDVPGLFYEYSNLGYALLGRIVTNVSGRPYQQYITETILKPLGMTNTYWEYKKVPATRLAHGYTIHGDSLQEEPLLSDGAYGAMGGLLTSIEDFSKYMALHIDAWPARSGKEDPVLKRSSLREMQTSAGAVRLYADFTYPDKRSCAITQSYSFGLSMTRDCDDKVWIAHSGGLPGFGSNWRFYPAYGIGIVCFSNLTFAPASSINFRVIDTLIKTANLQPRKLATSAILQERKDQLAKLLPGFRDPLPSIFADNFFLDQSADSLRKLVKTLYEKAGKITGIGELVPENQLRGTFILTGEQLDIEVFFTLTPEKVPLIQQLDFTERKKNNDTK